MIEFLSNLLLTVCESFVVFKQLVYFNNRLREGLRQATEVAPKARQHHKKGLSIYKNWKPLIMVVARPNDSTIFK